MFVLQQSDRVWLRAESAAQPHSQQHVRNSVFITRKPRGREECGPGAPLFHHDRGKQIVPRNSLVQQLGLLL